MYPYNPFLLKISFPFKSPLGSGDSSCGFVNSGFETRADGLQCLGFPLPLPCSSLHPWGLGARITLVGVQILHGEGSDVVSVFGKALQCLCPGSGWPFQFSSASHASRLGCCLQKKEGGAGWRLAIRTAPAFHPFPFFSFNEPKITSRV